MGYLFISFLVLSYFTIDSVLGAYTVESARNLYTALTFNYNADLRPEETVNVSVTLTLTSINYLDFEKQTFSVDGMITSIWRDSQFKWTPSSYGNISYAFLTKTNVWRPGIIIDNELLQKEVLNDDNLYMRIKHDDTVTWEQRHVFTVHCDLDSTLFPFDEQECFISIGTGNYDMNTVLLTHGTSSVITSGLEQNAEWSLKEMSLMTQQRRDSSDQYDFSHLIFNIKVKRNVVWYAVNILVPWIVFSLLGLGAFLVPAESGEKVAYTSTVLVVNTVLLGISASFLPTSSVSAPVLGVYMVSNLVLNGVETVLAIVSVRIYNKHLKVKVVPMTTQAVVKKLSKFLCNHFSGDENREIIDLTSDEKKKSHTLKSKFSVKGQNKVGPSPQPTGTGYQRMQSGSDFSPSVDPEMDGRTNLPSNSRYRPSSYTHMRPTSQLQERPSSYTGVRPMSMKSVAGIQIREKSFITDEQDTVYTAPIDNTIPAIPQDLTREPVVDDVMGNTETVPASALEKRPSEKSNKLTPSKATSFRSNLGKNENEITWTDVSHLFDFLCFVVVFFIHLLLTVVVYIIFLIV